MWQQSQDIPNKMNLAPLTRCSHPLLLHCLLDAQMRIRNKRTDLLYTLRYSFRKNSFQVSSLSSYTDYMARDAFSFTIYPMGN
jgi:hypothetical protein